MTAPASHTIKVIAAFAAIYLIWGSTFLGVQVALKGFPPFLLSTFRLLIAGISLAVFCMARKEKMPSAGVIGKYAVCGIVVFIGGIVSVAWAQQYLSSSMASVVITTPFWFILLDKRQLNFYFSSRWIIGGLLLGLVGVILLLGFKQGRSGSSSAYMQLMAILVIIAGSFFWVMGSLYLKYKPSPVSVYVTTSIQFISAGLFCALISYSTGEANRFSLQQVGTGPIVALLYLAIISSMLTFLAYIWLVKIKPPAIVSTYAYVNPVVAVLLGWGFAGEHISRLQLLALFIILCGLLCVNIPRYRLTRSA